MFNRALFVPVVACLVSSMAYGYQEARPAAVKSVVAVVANPAEGAGAAARGSAGGALQTSSAQAGESDLSALLSKTDPALSGDSPKPVFAAGSVGSMSPGLALGLILKLAVVLGLAYAASLVLRRINSRSIVRRGGRLQVQERLTTEIARAIDVSLSPKGVGVVIEARHLCMMMRGVEKQNSEAVTSCMLGRFKTDPRTRMEFLDLIR